jgi:preprotein translocase subunit YajC
MATTAGQPAGGFDFISLLLPLALGLLIFSMFRKQRKMQQQIKEQRTQMLPGTEVMTQFGLYGTIVSIDEDQNKAVLEISPGNTATVHTQALTKVVTQDAAPVPADEVPDDASSLTGAGHTPVVDETPEETAERLNRDQKNKDS